MKTYSITIDESGKLLEEDKNCLVLDVDDLDGIIDQLNAIAYGWAEPFTYFETKEVWKWKLK